ncbi:MAG: DUF309 domain-containing protein [Chloroflexota bacterium]
MPTLLSLCSDLFFTVQIQNAAKSLGWDWINVESETQIPAQPPLAPRAGTPADSQTDPPGHSFVAYVVEINPALIVVELNSRALPWEAWVAAAKTSPAVRRIPIIGFGSHTDLDQRSRALAAGCDAVLAQGRFSSAMAELIQKYARLPDPSAAQAAGEGALSELAKHGIELFNRGEYFEAHEELERAWNEETGPERELYRGILQIAVAYLQITRRNYNGAIKIFLRARQWLDPLPDVCRGVDVAALRKDAAEARAALETLGAERIGEFDLSLLKPVTLARVN